MSEGRPLTLRRLSPWRVLAWAFVVFLIVTMLHLVVTGW